MEGELATSRCFDCATLVGGDLGCVPQAAEEEISLDGGCAAAPSHGGPWALFGLLLLGVRRCRRAG